MGGGSQAGNCQDKGWLVRKEGGGGRMGGRLYRAGKEWDERGKECRNTKRAGKKNEGRKGIRKESREGEER